MADIETAKKAGQITHAEYLQLKTQAELTYETRNQGKGWVHRLADKKAVKEVSP